MKSLINMIIFAVLFHNASILASSPSFNCDRAYSQAEQLICNSSNLGELDQSLAKAYKQARSRLSRPIDKQLLRNVHEITSTFGLI